MSSISANFGFLQHSISLPRPVARRALPVLLAMVPVAASHSARAAEKPPVAAATTTAALPAERIELRSKWTAGQQLTYDMRLDGTASLQASPNVPSPLAGVPLDVEVRMASETRLDTLRVDETGAGVVVLRVPSLKLNAQTFGQKFDLTVQNGRSSLTLNGQRMGKPGEQDGLARALMAPPFALQISDRGRVLSAMPIAQALQPATIANDAAPAPENTNGAKARPKTGMPFDPSAMLQSVFWRAVPSLWPTTSVATGERWTIDVVWPPPGVTLPGATATDEATEKKALAPTSLGKIDFVLRGVEQIAGRKVLRIGLNGAFAVDEAKVEALRASTEALQKGAVARAAAPQGAATPDGNALGKAPARGRFTQKLNRTSQKMKGDVWFDPEVGQLVRAELELEAQGGTRDVPLNANGKTAAAPAAKPGVAPIDDSWVDFTGTMQLQLKSVAQKPVEAAPAPANG